MAIRYLTWRGPDGLETIDEMDTSEHEKPGKERARIREEYAMAGMAGAYWSRRPCKDWRD